MTSAPVRGRALHALGTEDLAILARSGNRRAASALTRRCTPGARELARALSDDPRSVPRVVRQAVRTALADDQHAYGVALVGAVSRAATSTTQTGPAPREDVRQRRTRAVGVLIDVQGHTAAAAAAALGLSPAEVTELHAASRRGVGADRARTACRGWPLVSRDDLSVPEQTAAAGHLSLCRTCRDALAARALARARLKAALPLGGGLLGGGVLAAVTALSGGASTGAAATTAGIAAVGTSVALVGAGVVSVPHVVPDLSPPARPVPAAAPALGGTSAAGLAPASPAANHAPRRSPSPTDLDLPTPAPPGATAPGPHPGSVLGTSAPGAASTAAPGSLLPSTAAVPPMPALPVPAGSGLPLPGTTGPGSGVVVPDGGLAPVGRPDARPTAGPGSGSRPGAARPDDDRPRPTTGDPAVPSRPVLSTDALPATPTVTITVAVTPTVAAPVPLPAPRPTVAVLTPTRPTSARPTRPAPVATARPTSARPTNARPTRPAPVATASPTSARPTSARPTNARPTSSARPAGPDAASRPTGAGRPAATDS